MIISNIDWSLFDVGRDEPLQSIEVFDRPHERVSDLLGPDGHPLTLQYSRPAIGFDLRPRGQK